MEGNIQNFITLGQPLLEEKSPATGKKDRKQKTLLTVSITDHALWSDQKALLMVLFLLFLSEYLK
jgi:hypothetical protein